MGDKMKVKFSENGEVYSGKLVKIVKNTDEDNIPGVNVVFDDNCIHFVPNDLIVEVVNE